MENETYLWFSAILIPLAAPVITKVINRYGSEKVKTVWGKVRRLYRRTK